MNQNPIITTNERNILVRGLYMILMAFAYQLTGTLLLIIAIIQFCFALFTDAPNARLVLFGRSMANYSKQLVAFFTFASEDVPFPFSDWPSGE